jgi:hypothetical protein
MVAHPLPGWRADMECRGYKREVDCLRRRGADPGLVERRRQQLIGLARTMGMHAATYEIGNGRIRVEDHLNRAKEYASITTQALLSDPDLLSSRWRVEMR